MEVNSEIENGRERIHCPDCGERLSREWMLSTLWPGEYQIACHVKSRDSGMVAVIGEQQFVSKNMKMISAAEYAKAIEEQ